MRSLVAEESAESLINAIETFNGNIANLDHRIFEKMEENEDVIKLFDDYSFRTSFVRGLNKVVTKLLISVQVDSPIFSSIGDQSAPLLFENFKVDENVVMELLKRHHNQISNCVSFETSETKENLLHNFLKMGLTKATKTSLKFSRVNAEHST